MATILTRTRASCIPHFFITPLSLQCFYLMDTLSPSNHFSRNLNPIHSTWRRRQHIRPKRWNEHPERRKTHKTSIWGPAAMKVSKKYLVIIVLPHREHSPSPVETNLCTAWQTLSSTSFRELNYVSWFLGFYTACKWGRQFTLQY